MDSNLNKNDKHSGESTELQFRLSPNAPAKIDAFLAIDAANSSSDFNQWLHAMKMVARLPGGMPPEFRRKLWLALAERHMNAKGVNWKKEEEKCFCAQWREDDEELGIQIVKDLHRTGSSLCSGPAGSINQAKLKRILLGYARWNPDVGYCQGFNMLGALILQVMDKNEVESIKVMIFLVEGVLPPGYFSGSLGGLQADMAVFIELLNSKLPRLAKHLHKLQGPVGDGCFEPPLTNVFTMQWFLTLFCTCLPANCTLRVWDLVLIEGSDVLLRTALAIWTLLEERILRIRTADDFYCTMGALSSELLNGHIIDSNGLIEKVVQLGPIGDLQKLRDKHLYNITPWRDKRGLKIFYSDDEDSDDDSRLAVTTAWGLRLSRRSSGHHSNIKSTDSKDRLALDISLLKKQYERLRERQKQAHIILTTAVAKHDSNHSASTSIQVNQLLAGKTAIVPQKGRRLGPPAGAIPPARKVVNLTPISANLKQTKSTEVVSHRNKDIKEINPARIKAITETTGSYMSGSSITYSTPLLAKVRPSNVIRTRKPSESSSYSEESDTNSSTSTSLCDNDEEMNESGSFKSLELEGSFTSESEELSKIVFEDSQLPNIYSSNSEIRQIEQQELSDLTINKNLAKSELNKNSLAAKSDTEQYDKSYEFYSNEEEGITSTSQLSPIPDISTYLSTSAISPLKTPSEVFDFSNSTNLTSYLNKEENDYKVNDEGVTNEYFERVNITEKSKMHSFSDSMEKINLQESLVMNDDFEKNSNKDENKTDLAKVSQSLQFEVDKNLQSFQSSLPYTASVMLSPKSLHVSENFIKTYAEIQSLDYKPSSSIDSITSNSLIAGYTKEDSLDEQQTKSCPVNIPREDQTTDRVLKIIEENSVILHRILKNKPLSSKNISFEKEYFNSSLENESSNNSKYENEEKAKVDLAKNIFRSPLRETYTDKKLLSSEESINERLASIKSTIKSIDSLCDDKQSYHREKYYADTAFPIEIDTENSSKLLEIAISQNSPKNKYNNEFNNDGEKCKTNFTTHQAQEMTRGISPGKRTDNEIYENRICRAGLPDSIHQSKDNSCSILENTLKNNNSVDQVKMSIQSSANTKYIPPKIEIRHTTVTSTFYDRYLFHKMEEQEKAQKLSSSYSLVNNTSSDKHSKFFSTECDLTLRNSTITKSPTWQEKSPSRVLCSSISPKTLTSKSDIDMNVYSSDNILLDSKSENKEHECQDLSFNGALTSLTSNEINLVSKLTEKDGAFIS